MDREKMEKLILDADEDLVYGIFIGLMNTHISVVDSPDLCSKDIVEFSTKTLNVVIKFLEGKN